MLVPFLLVSVVIVSYSCELALIVIVVASSVAVGFFKVEILASSGDTIAPTSDLPGEILYTRVTGGDIAVTCAVTVAETGAVMDDFGDLFME